MLPLLEQPSYKISTIKQAIDNLRSTVAFLNPTQVPVLDADQPPFALAKQIQWKWPELYGESKFVVMLGGLHIEMEFLKTIGTVLDSSGGHIFLTKAGICGAGTADFYIKVCHIKRTRYAHQLTAACLYTLQQEACGIFVESSNQDSLQREEWILRMKKQSGQFFFWSLVMHMEMLTFCLIKSFRTGDFLLYTRSLSEFIPYLFALDKVNYSRWLSVHIKDMLSLYETSPDVHQQFMSGNFTVRKSNWKCSSMSIDQAHEQNNEKLKHSLNAISLMETPGTLRRWLLSAPHIDEMLSEFNADLPGFVEKEDLRHADDRLAKQRVSNADLQNLIDAFHSIGNSFLDSSGHAIVILETSEIAEKDVENNIRGLCDKGQTLYHDFITERLQRRDGKVTDPMKLNKLKLLSRKFTTKQGANFREKMRGLKNDCNLFSQLYIDCHRRGGDLDEFFAHENRARPPAFSSSSVNKAQLLSCIVPDTLLDYCNSPSSSSIIFDGAVMVQLIIPCRRMTFAGYAESTFVKCLMSLSKDASRVDLVFDQYHENSLKALTRSKRGLIIARRVTLDSTVPNNWKEFLRNDKNKSPLFALLSQFTISRMTEKDDDVFATVGPDVLTNSNSENLAPYHQEEADGRLLFHVADAARCGHTITNVTIRSVDTDVVVLAISFFSRINVHDLSIAYGTGKDFRYLPIHEIVNSLGPDKTESLLFLSFLHRM